jgi:hypothetical protein
MFGVPERRAENDSIAFYVPVKTPVRLGLRLQASAENSIVPDVTTAGIFNNIRTRALTELTKTDQLFKNKPTLESLHNITPKWGIIYNETADHKQVPIWSPYTHFLFPNVLTYPCIVDLELIAILITRSTISPQFSVLFLEEAKKNVIDFDWPVTSPTEIEEIDDILLVDTQPMTLKDPVLLQKEKAAEKEHVRMLFRTADTARQNAVNAMTAFFDKYHLSDDESQFSDMADSESQSEGDPFRSEAAERDYPFRSGAPKGDM